MPATFPFMNPCQKLVWVIIFFSIHETNGQTVLKTYTSRYNTQYGFSLKATIEFGCGYKDHKSDSYQKPNPFFHLCADIGVGSDFAVPWVYPSFNLEIQLYNGGIGSRRAKDDMKKPEWEVDMTAAFTLTAGVRNQLRKTREYVLRRRTVPLYYFTDFVYPALQNPFDWSLSLGTNLVFPLTDKRKKKQRVGFINGHFYPIQISYANDGGVPIHDIYLGDRRDRYYTGSVLFSYHGKRNTALELVELGYKKFTGYTKNAFEISNKLYLNFMNYHDSQQRQYNKSLWTLNFASISKGVGIKFTSYDVVLIDVQHRIHWSLYNAYHMVPYKPHIGISGSYYYNFTKAGLQ